MKTHNTSNTPHKISNPQASLLDQYLTLDQKLKSMVLAILKKYSHFERGTNADTLFQELRQIEYYLASLRLTLSCAVGGSNNNTSPLHAQKMTIIQSIENSLSLLDDLKVPLG